MELLVDVRDVFLEGLHVLLEALNQHHTHRLLELHQIGDIFLKYRLSIRVLCHLIDVVRIKAQLFGEFSFHLLFGFDIEVKSLEVVTRGSLLLLRRSLRSRR